MKFFALILFTALLAKLNEAFEDPYYSLDDVIEMENERQEALDEIGDILWRMMKTGLESQNSLDDLQKTKRIAVVNEIEGENVVTNIKGTETNHYGQGQSRRHTFGPTYAKRVVTEVEKLFEQLKRSDSVSEKLLSHAEDSQEQVNAAKRKLNQELRRTMKSLEELLHDVDVDDKVAGDLEKSIRRAARLVNKFSNDKLRRDSARVAQALDDEIDLLMQLGMSFGKRVLGWLMSSMKDEMGDEEQHMVEALDREISFEKRRLEMQNRIKGQHVTVNQEFHETNFGLTDPNAKQQPASQSNDYEDA